MVYANTKTYAEEYSIGDFMRNYKLYSTVLTVALLSGLSYAEPEVTGKITIESAKFTGNGNLIGNKATSGSVVPGGTKIPANQDVFKSEVNARIYVDGALDNLKEGSTYHLELQAYSNSQDINNYDGNESYTQRDPLREAYIDTDYNDWLIRAGKQQVVWGTADGIKLLDSINPTDYSELVQNQMEDSRMPIWMLNADRSLEDGGNFQLIVSEQRANKIPGMNSSGDVGHAFIMKGVDSITGKVNGFLNVVPALAGVASSFNAAATGASNIGGFQQANASTAGTMVTGWNGSSSSLVPFTGFTVDGFAGNTIAGTGGYDVVSSPGQMLSNGQVGVGGTYDATTASNLKNGYDILADFATWGGRNSSATATDGNTFANINNGNTNLINLTRNGTLTGDATGAQGTYNPLNPTATFEYMPNATFATFNTFGGVSDFATAKYIKDSNAQDGANVGFRYKNTTESGINYSLNFMRKADSNPYIDMDWYDKTTGEKLTTVLRSTPTSAADSGMPLASSGSTITRSEVPNSISVITAANSTPSYSRGNATNGTTVLLKNSAGEYYGAQSPTGSSTNYAGASKRPELRMIEKSNDITSIGGSFDMAVDTETLGPVVIRGEALYNKDEMSPIINRKLLAIGDLPGALQMKKGDMLRYVLGVDITALTNMMISTQFIQMRNLDFVDNACTGTTQMSNTYDCSEYTGDMATMHLTNGLKKAKKNKEFYSLFLSKPFGESGQHRWNNIFMFEEGGGKWNRLDAEYTLDDDTVLTAEYNKYFGDENTQFGQFKNSSNVQLGVKYSF